jgi:HAD superfamily hydrolase (TIGR01459 family)
MSMAAARRRLTVIAGLADIADRFDHVLLDQFGVLHDGQRLYPEVVDCLARLRAAGKSTTILSNSGKPGTANVKRLAAIGLPADSYDRMITSGDALRISIQARDDPPFDRLGRRCYLVSTGGDRTMIDGLDLDVVAEIGSADFILFAGLDPEAAELEPWRPRFAPAIAAGLPLICANPDLTMFSPRGLLPGPGAIAGLYGRMGGAVTYIGKPHPQIYAVALAALRHPPASRVVAIGDSLDHDVLGARRTGIASVFVTGGIHAAEFAVVTDTAETTDLVRRLAGGGDKTPDWVMSTLAWHAPTAGVSPP